MGRFKDIQLAELPDEIWIHIMLKLPIKPLHICKCVSKTWHSHVSYILNTQKGLRLHPYGLLFNTVRYQLPFGHPNWSIDEKEYSISYLSLADYKSTSWSLDGQTKSATVDMNDHHKDRYDANGNGLTSLSLGNLTVDYGNLVSNTMHNIFWTIHRGLILISSRDTFIFHVYNPATREKFVLPMCPSLARRVRGLSKPRYCTIINLSDYILSSQCNFRVISFNKELGGGRVVAEVFSSSKDQWSEYEFCLKKAVCLAHWACEQVSSAYSLRIPKRVLDGRGVLHGSQGCLYLCYSMLPGLWIWKHNGSSLDVQGWIPQLVFEEPGISLCQLPVAEECLRQFVANSKYIAPIAFHPEAPVVFIYVAPSLFAFNLMNDTVEKIAEIKRDRSCNWCCLHVLSMLCLIGLS
uniref:F-box domain-containing protein n=1 Tax=Chenopodium quinoa TaxID=63459 RepID=A0A803M9R4_CHEQI